MSHRTQQVKVIECDGCGYLIPNSVEPTLLELRFVRGTKKVKVPLHFHPVNDEQDCLRYWFTGTGIMKRQFESHELLSDDDIEFLVKHLSAQPKITV